MMISKDYWRKWIKFKVINYGTYIITSFDFLLKTFASSQGILLLSNINDIFLSDMFLNDMDGTLEYWYTSYTSSTLVVLTINEFYIESGNNWGWNRLTPIDHIQIIRRKRCY